MEEDSRGVGGGRDHTRSGAPEGWCAGEECRLGEKLGQGDSKMGGHWPIIPTRGRRKDQLSERLEGKVTLRRTEAEESIIQAQEDLQGDLFTAHSQKSWGPPAFCNP